MKKTLFLAFVFVAIWAAFNAYLLGIVPLSYVPEEIIRLSQPTSTASLGDSAAIIDSLFSSIALALGLIAVLMQGKELREATKAQSDQAISLAKQLQYQENLNRLGAYSARLQYLLSEADRIDSKITELVNNVDTISDKDEKSKKWQLIKNLRAKEISYREEATEIDVIIKEQLRQT